MSLRVVGLDLSLRSTGISDGQQAHAAHTYETDPIEDRINALWHECWDAIAGATFDRPGAFPAHPKADLVVIEGAAYGARGNAVDQLAGLRWRVRCELRSMRVPFVIVTPSTLKAYTTGNGRASKPQMVQAVMDRHGMDLSLATIKEGRYDMADAFALSAMGYAYVNQPLATKGPPPRTDSLLAPDWPIEAQIMRAAPDLKHIPHSPLPSGVGEGQWFYPNERTAP